MIFVAVYWLFLLTTLGVGWALGNADTRRGVTIIATATCGTMIAQVTLDEGALTAAILAIDVFLFAMLVLLSLRSSRFWPMWFSALCAVGVLANATAYIFPHADSALYQNYAGFWAIPALLALLVGTLLDSGIEPTKA